MGFPDTTPARLVIAARAGLRSYDACGRHDTQPTAEGRAYAYGFENGARVVLASIAGTLDCVGPNWLEQMRAVVAAFDDGRSPLPKAATVPTRADSVCGECGAETLFSDLTFRHGRECSLFRSGFTLDRIADPLPGPTDEPDDSDEPAVSPWPVRNLTREVVQP
jgi:hypothetical protein